MIQNHVVMMINAVILIALGIYGYFTSGSPTALIAPAIGLVLFALSFPTKKENHVAAHIAVGLTLVAAITFIFIGIKRANVMVIAMGVITFVCFDIYILNFILRKRKREASK